MEQPSSEHEVDAAFREYDVARQHLLEALSRHPEYLRRPRAGATLLHDLATAGETDFVRAVLAAGESPDVRDATGRSPLHYAALYGCLDTIDCLCRAGADANARDKQGWTPLRFGGISSSGKYQSITAVLVANGAELDVWTAIKTNQEAAARRLLAEGAADIRQHELAAQALLDAVLTLNPALLQLVLETGVDPKGVNPADNSPLRLAVAYGPPSVVKLLLQYGASANASYGGKSLLQLALERRDESRESLVQILKDHGAR